MLVEWNGPGVGRTKEVLIHLLHNVNGLLEKLRPGGGQAEGFGPGVFVMLLAGKVAFLLQRTKYFGSHHPVNVAVGGYVYLRDRFLFLAQPGQGRQQHELGVGEPNLVEGPFHITLPVHAHLPEQVAGTLFGLLEVKLYLTHALPDYRREEHLAGRQGKVWLRDFKKTPPERIIPPRHFHPYGL